VKNHDKSQQMPKFTANAKIHGIREFRDLGLALIIIYHIVPTTQVMRFHIISVTITHSANINEKIYELFVHLQPACPGTKAQAGLDANFKMKLKL